MRNKGAISPKTIILITVFMDVVGIGLVVPVLPFYIESFGLGAGSITAIFTSYAIFSFLSSPILGALSDRKGRRPILLVSLFSTAVGWLVFAFTQSVLGLYLGRIIDGIAAGNISTAQSYLIDISKDDKDRAKNLGLIGAVFGIAFIVGPLIGGILSKIYLPLPFIVVGILASVNTILAFFFLPETHHNRNTSKMSFNPFKPIMKAFKSKSLTPLYLSWMLFGIAVTTNQSVFALYLKEEFNWGVLASGVMMTIVGIIISLNQAFLIRKFWLKRYTESYLNLYILLPFALSYILMGLPYKGIFIAGLVLSAIGHSVLRVTMTSQTVAQAPKHEQGEVTGVMMSLMSLAMIIGPTAGGFLYVFGVNFPYFLSAVIILIMFFMTYALQFYMKKKQHIDIPPVEAI